MQNMLNEAKQFIEAEQKNPTPKPPRVISGWIVCIIFTVTVLTLILAICFVMSKQKKYKERNDKDENTRRNTKN